MLFSADTRELSRGLQDAGNRTRQFSRSAQKHVGAAAKSFRGMANRVVNTRTVIATLAGSGGLGLLVRSNMQAIDSLNDFAQTIQGNVTNIQALRRQSELAGVATGTMDSALQRATRRAAQAVDGTGAASDAFDRLSLSAEEVSRKSPVEAFWAQAEAISELTDRSQQLRAANELFGREAEDVIRIIDRGEGEFRDIREEMERTGQALSDIDAARVAQAAEAVERAKQSFSAAGQVLTVELAPYIEAVADSLTEAMNNADGVGDAVLSAVERGSTALGVLADGLHGIRIAFHGLRTVAYAFGEAGFEIFWSLAETVSTFMDGVIGKANEAIDALNRLPRVDIARIDPVGDSDFMESVRSLGQRTRENTREAQQELHNLAMQELPSSRIDSFLSDVRKRADEFELPEDTLAASAAGAPDSEADEARRESMQERLEDLQSHLRSEEEEERLSQRKRMEDLDMLREEGFIQDEIYYEMKEELEAQHHDRLNDIQRSGMTEAERIHADARKAMEQGWRASGLYVANQLQQMTDGIAQHSRAAFEINKAASIAQALLKVPEAASNAYAWASAFGGPPAGAAAAAAAVAAQMAQVQAIRGTSFDGSGGGAAPSVSGSTPADPVTPVSQQEDSGPSRRVFVEFEGGDDQQVSLRQMRKSIRDLKEEDPEAELVF